MCYVVNAWAFSSTIDPTGYEIIGLQPLTRIQRPAATIYFADNENGSWRPVFTATSSEASESMELSTMWQPTAKPTPTPTQPPHQPPPQPPPRLMGNTRRTL